MEGKLVSLNVSEVKKVEWRGKTITTGIYKVPVQKPLKVQGVNIDGDDQANRKVHGGEYKAIYAYPLEHYPYWKEKYPYLDFEYGMFGENLTTEGLLEEELYIGDQISIDSTQLMIVQPRQPCFKLGIKFGTQSIVKQFRNTSKSGFYLKIIQEGYISPGADIEYRQNPDPKVTIAEMVQILRREADIDLVRLAVNEENLPPGIRYHIQEWLDKQK